MGEKAGTHIDALYILDPENGHAQDLAGTLLGTSSQKSRERDNSFGRV